MCVFVLVCELVRVRLLGYDSDFRRVISVQFLQAFYLKQPEA
jgi:hypothetical protein